MKTDKIELARRSIINAQRQLREAVKEDGVYYEDVVDWICDLWDLETRIRSQQEKELARKRHEQNQLAAE